MKDPQSSTLLRYVSRKRQEHIVRALDLLIEEEKRLEERALKSDGSHRFQAMADLTVNHSRTADLLVTLLRLQPGA